MRKLLSFFIFILIFSACKSEPQPIIKPVIRLPERIAEIPAPVQIPEPEPEPEPVIVIMEPVFSIVSIVILQADLVVTEFETVLKVENPNNFEVDLSSLIYELHGNGSFWANGRGNNILLVPALSSSETKFRFKMNFIDMSRRLLDEVIAMRQINYNFKGQAQVQPDIPDYPAFITNFNCTGLSEVRR